MELYELARKLKDLKAEKKCYEKEMDDLVSQIEIAEKQLIAFMLENETPNFTHSGTTYYLNNKILASAVADKKTELFGVLKNNGFGDLIYETVNANSFSSFIKEQISFNNDILPKWLDGYVNIYEKQAIGMRKSK